MLVHQYRTFKLFIFIFLPLAIALSSCAKSALVKVLENDLLLEGKIPSNDRNTELRPFEGIGDIMGFTPNDIAGKSKELNVLMVPGVRRKQWSNYNSLIAFVAKELKFSFDTLETFINRTPQSLEDDLLGSGELSIFRFVRGDNQESKLNFYMANWTSVTAPAKDALIAFDKDPDGEGEEFEELERTYLADTAKHAYMIDIFSDMGLYRQADYRCAINHTVLEALAKIKESGDNPLVCITGSMGSEIILEVFGNPAQVANCAKGINLNQRDIEAIGKNLKHIFMLNNQLVFSSILDYSSTDLGNDVGLEKKVKAKLSTIAPIAGKNSWKIISFYDPNDILGFQVQDQFINIPISHTSQWSIDAKRLKDNYLARLPLGKSKNKIMAMVGDTGRINIGIGLDGPSEFAKTNSDVFNYIIQGSDWNPKAVPDNPPKKEAAETGTKNRFGISWRDSKKELKRKRASIQRVLRILWKVSGMTRAVDLPYNRAPNISLSGLEDAVKEKENDTTFVLTVHGMGNKTPNHFDHMASEIAKRLGFIPNFSIEDLDVGIRGADLKFGIRKLAFRNSENKHLIFMVVHWSPITRPVKDQLFALDEEAFNSSNFLPRRRSYIHKTLKDRVIIDGFVDVNLALGDGNFLGIISKAVGKGMDLIYEADPSDKKNVFFISGSLGSKILYEHITQAMLDPQTDTELRDHTGIVLEKTRTWYMLSNQIPMIGLKELNAINRARPFEKQVWHALEKVEQMPKGVGWDFDMDVIAFHDPNDLMTFRLPTLKGKLGDKFRIQNLPLRTGGGFEVDIYDMYKFVRRVDRTLYNKLREENQKKIKDLRKKNVEAIDLEMNLLRKMQSKIKDTDPAYKLILARKEQVQFLQDRAEKQKRQKTLLLIPSLENLYDMKNTAEIASQKFMVRFDKAHDKVSENERVLDVIVFGLEKFETKNLR